MEIVYSSQRDGFVKGRAYRNPRFFHGVDEKVTSVIVIGDWPTVVASYEEAGVPVTVVPVGSQLPSPDIGIFDPPDDGTIVGKKPKEGDPIKDPPNDPNMQIDPPPPEPIVIPDDDKLADMVYRDLQKLVKEIDPNADVSGKKAAIAFLIEKRDAE